jgi:diketogulonate reductase-like aldo/keto reductase
MEGIDMSRLLSNGVEIPSIGMGTYPLKDDALIKAIVAATSCGYRSFDTAKAYGNEKSLGNALREAYSENQLKRSDVFITSKIGENLDHGIPDGKYFYLTYKNENKNIKGIVSDQLDEILESLKTDYLDLLLIHWPFPDYLVEIWKAMEGEYRSGRVRAIGVSNFRERHIQTIINSGSIAPMVNQFELHPLNTKKGLIDYCHELEIEVQAYSPLLVMNQKLTNAPILKHLSKKYNKSIPQIILRWHIEQGVIPIPKSGNSTRLKENITIFDFKLTNDEILGIDMLNENYTSLVESRYCPGY